MNITLSEDKSVIDKARQIARRQGTSLNGLIRGYLRMLVQQDNSQSPADELMHLLRTEGGRSGGRKWCREDAYEGRT